MAVLGIKGFLFVGVFAILCGCSYERGEGRFTSLDYMVMDMAVLDTSIPDGEPPGALESASGTWMLLSEDRICILGGIGDPVDNIIWSVFLVQINDETKDAILPQTVRMCGQDLSPLPFGFLTVVPERLSRSFREHSVSGFLVNRVAGGAYLTAPFVDLWGVAEVGAEEPMPMDPGDVRVVDQDGDERPGVTLTVTSAVGTPICEVEVIQRVVIQLRGRVVSSRRIAGEFESTSSKVVLGASSDLCNSGDIGPNHGKKTFHMVRIDGIQGSPDLDDDGDGRIDCDEVRRGRERVQTYYRIERGEPDIMNCLGPSDDP
jgi:hypothetical protein